MYVFFLLEFVLNIQINGKFESFFEVGYLVSFLYNDCIFFIWIIRIRLLGFYFDENNLYVFNI